MVNRLSSRGCVRSRAKITRQHAWEAHRGEIKIAVSADLCKGAGAVIREAHGARLRSHDTLRIVDTYTTASSTSSRQLLLAYVVCGAGDSKLSVGVRGWWGIRS
eukprot:COSAG01_NODE_34718_length_543_cov_0.815315_2_plen_103_part_01